jgi:hypothetical protein
MYLPTNVKYNYWYKSHLSFYIFSDINIRVSVKTKLRENKFKKIIKVYLQVYYNERGSVDTEGS